VDDHIDLRHEQLQTLARPRYPYSSVTKTMVRGMDVFAGEATTLVKAKIVETLAPIPYRAWENHEYTRLARHPGDDALVRESEAVLHWGREAQDREYHHLRVIDAKLREDGAGMPWRLSRPMPELMAGSWSVASRTLSVASMRFALLLNAEAEDHAEHYYAELVELHPEWEEQPVRSAAVGAYGEFDNWADVFRRIGLDERDHMNASFAFAGAPEKIVSYDGMPPTPGLDWHVAAGAGSED
jgi:ubiquinol oxidase